MTFTGMPKYEWEKGMSPMSHVVPFTYKDGMTFLELLKSFQWFINEQLVPELNKRIDDVNAIIDEELAKFADVSESWQTAFDEFMANVNAELRALNDEAVSQLVADAGSELRVALDAWFDNRFDSRFEHRLDDQFTDRFDNRQQETLDPETAALVNTEGTALRDALGEWFSPEFESHATNLVRGVGVGRIIASRNVEYPIVDGDLLVMVDSPQFFTDFSSYDVGEVPRDWSTRWNSEEVVTVETESTATGGQAAFLNPEWNGAYAISWDALDDVAQDYDELEIVIKFKGVNPSPRVVSHGSGAGGHGYGYYAGPEVEDDTVIVGSYVDGDSTSYFGDPGVMSSYNDGEWWVFRYRLGNSSGTSWESFVRVWRHGHPEPDVWHHNTNVNSDFPRGWVGFFLFRASEAYVDWFGAAFGGGRAPMGG